MSEALRGGLLAVLLVSFVAANFALQEKRLRGSVPPGQDPATAGQSPRRRPPMG